MVSYIYELPFGPGRRFNPKGFAGEVVPRGWELAGAVTFQSGLPLAVSQATNFNAFAGFGTQRPNRVATLSCLRMNGAQHSFLTPSAFVGGAAIHFGDQLAQSCARPRLSERRPGFIKRTYIRERMNLEFRAEAFNLTNTPPLNAPNAVLATPGFGSITSAGDPRVLQFAVKFNF